MLKKKKNRKSSKMRDTATKKEAVLSEENKSNRTYIIAVVIIAIFSGVLYFISKEKNSINKVQAKENSPIYFQNQSSLPEGRVNTEKTISYNASFFNDEKAKYFQYRYGNITIKYFILRSSDGIIRAAFDACDVCWPAGKGYYQKGDKMVCRNCGRKFASKLVNEIKGGCNPAPLKRRIVNEQVIINIQDIIHGADYFNFARRS